MHSDGDGHAEGQADRRRYVQRMLAEPRARRKLQIYAGAIRAIAERMGPLHLVLRDAAAQAPELARVRDEIAARRARNMRRLAQDLVATGDCGPSSVSTRSPTSSGP